MYNLIGADELMSKGVSSMSQLRPVLGAHENPIASNATLRKDEWETIDDRVNDVLRERLTIVDDVRGRGLVTPVSLGTILRVTERLGDISDADVTYDGDTAPTRDRPEYSRDVIPVPVISKDFTVNWRQLDASRMRGEALDVTAAAMSTRKVRDRLQAMFANGYTAGPGTNPSSGADGQSIPGLTNAGNRLTVSLGTNWDASGSDIIGDVEAMLAEAYANYLFGPFYIYVPKNYWAILQADYSSVKGDRTFIQRVMAFEDVQAVRPLDALADDNVVMVQMTEDVLDLTEAQAPTTVQWDKSPFVVQMRVLTVAGPHIKNMETQAGDTIHGIVHLS